MSTTLAVDVQIASNATDLPPDADIRRWLEDTLAHVGRDSARAGEITVRIVDEQEGAMLNQCYRQRSRATNVLSFPAALPAPFDTIDEPLPLGDLVVCAPVIAREAQQQGKPLADHWAHLLVHGALHLLGYDHDSDSDAAAMEKLEIEILAARGVTNPYCGSGA